MLNITIRGHDLSQVQTIGRSCRKTKEQRDPYTAARLRSFVS